MSIFKIVEETINRYGSSIKVQSADNSGNIKNSKAFIQPLRYKNKVYIGDEIYRLGHSRTQRYLYIGLSENELAENSSVIECESGKYIVKRCETYYLRDYPLYVWAILLPYGERLEDDYESG